MNSPSMPPPPPPGFVYTQPKQKRNTLVIVIVAVAVAGFALMAILVLATLAIPAMQSTVRRGNETSAIASLRLLNTVQALYNSNYPNRGFACSLGNLGGTPGNAPPSPQAAQLIPDDLASGHKSGYTFTLTCSNKVTVNNIDQYTSYHITAVPIALRHTGNRGFCTDENAQIRFDPKGGANCTELLQ